MQPEPTTPRECRFKHGPDRVVPFDPKDSKSEPICLDCVDVDSPGYLDAQDD